MKPARIRDHIAMAALIASALPLCFVGWFIEKVTGEPL